jgi:uncharacterized protein YlxW (UPF0749 family)
MVIGFMIAIQFQTVQEPDVRDTRDTWQLREDLLKEKELQSKLIKEIRLNEEKLAKYETEREQSKEQALRETLNELKEEAGLTDVKGPGMILSIEPIIEGVYPNEMVGSISPDLLRRLVNELNMHGAKHISIDGQRLINTSVIRDINRETKVNGHSLSRLPIEIKVITENSQKAEKLYNQLQVSKAIEDFFIDNLRVQIMKPAQTGNIVIPAYQDSNRVRNIEPVKADKGGK